MTTKKTTKKKRGYSRDFTALTERRVKYDLDRIPPTLYDAVVRKARREGISLRALTLTLWRDWLDTTPPPTTGAPEA